MKELSKETRKILDFNWNVRLKLHAEGDKLYAEGNKLHAEGNKLHAEGNKLRAEGNKLWAETILKFVGNIKLEWKDYKENKGYECHLETGDVFRP